MRERQQARAVDKRRNAAQLEIQFAIMRTATFQHEVTHQTERRFVAQGILGHLPQEAWIAGRLLAHPLAQFSNWRVVARQRAEIKEDAGLEQVLGGAVINPVTEACLPLIQRQAALRIAGHDIAGAQGIPAVIEHRIDALRQRQQGFAQAIGLAAPGQHKQDAVVLIGLEGLLLATLAAERQPGKGQVRRARFRQHQFDSAACHVVVEQRDDLRELGDRDALRQHLVDQPVNIARVARQTGDIRRLGDNPRQPGEPDALQGEQIALRHDSAQPAFLHHAHMTNRFARHHQRRRVHRIRWRERGHLGGHDLLDRGIK